MFSMQTFRSVNQSDTQWLLTSGLQIYRFWDFREFLCECRQEFLAVWLIQLCNFLMKRKGWGLLRISRSFRFLRLFLERWNCKDRLSFPRYLWFLRIFLCHHTLCIVRFLRSFDEKFHQNHHYSKWVLLILEFEYKHCYLILRSKSNSSSLIL